MADFKNGRIVEVHNADCARVAQKARNHGWVVVWDEGDQQFLLCDQMLHNIYCKGTLEEIESMLEERA